MELKCCYCCKYTHKSQSIVIDSLFEEEKNIIYNASKELFGNRINPTMACDCCLAEIKIYYELKMKVISNNVFLKKSVEFTEEIDKFIENHGFDQIKIMNVHGILMIVPNEKWHNVAIYKCLKNQFAPRVELRRLPIKFANESEIQEEIETEHEKKDEANENVAETMHQENVLNEADEINFSSDDNPENYLEEMFSEKSILSKEVSDNVSDYASCDMDISCDELSLPAIKLEPNVQIVEAESDGKKISDEEDKYVADNIEKLKNNFSIHQYRCKQCKKKFRVLQGIKGHIKTFHLKRKPNGKMIKKRESDNLLTEDERKFLHHNITMKKVYHTNKALCGVCGDYFKNFASARNHILMAHFRKKRSDFDPNYMKRIIIRKGSIASNLFQCIICRDNGNPIEYAKQSFLLAHLGEHKRSDIMSYSRNHDAFIEPNHPLFDHPLL